MEGAKAGMENATKVNPKNLTERHKKAQTAAPGVQRFC
jgi:hypothetical protein